MKHKSKSEITIPQFNLGNYHNDG